MSCGSDPVLLWLWLRPEATALIRRLAWEPPYAAGSDPRKGKKTKKKIIIVEFGGAMEMK